MSRRPAFALLVVLVVASCGGEPAQKPPPRLEGRQLSIGRMAGLPKQGLAIWRRSSVVLVSLDGRVVGHVRGLRPDLVRRWPRGRILLRDRTGREYALDARGFVRTSRPPVVRDSYGCRPNEAPYVVCWH